MSINLREIVKIVGIVGATRETIVTSDTKVAVYKTSIELCSGFSREPWPTFETAKIKRKKNIGAEIDRVRVGVWSMR